MIDANEEISTADKLLRQAVYIAFDGKCFYTGRDVPFEEMHIDHIIPIARGGRNCISNYVMTCQYINLRKNALSSVEFQKIVKEIVFLVFVPKVKTVYSDLSHNKEGFVQINDWLRDNGIIEGSKDWFRARNILRDKNKIPHIEKILPNKSRGILLFREEDIKFYLSGRRDRGKVSHGKKSNLSVVHFPLKSEAPAFRRG